MAERHRPGAGRYASLLREYARLAPGYDRRWRAYIEASVNNTLSRVEPHAVGRLLDVGCGTGECLRRAGVRWPGAAMTGVDLSPDMLAVAAAKLGSGTGLIRASAEALPLADACVDTVVSTNMIHFARRPLTVFREMHRVLERDGMAVVTDWCGDYLTCRLLARFLMYFDRAHVRTYHSEAFHRLFTDAGFSDIRIERYRVSPFWGLMTATARKLKP